MRPSFKKKEKKKEKYKREREMDLQHSQSSGYGYCKKTVGKKRTNKEQGSITVYIIYKYLIVIIYYISGVVLSTAHILISPLMGTVR